MNSSRIEGGKKRALRVPVSGLALGALRLSEDTSKYVTKVHRVRMDARLRLFDPELGLEGEGVVESADSRQVVVRVEVVRPAPENGLRVTLLQALGKGDKPERALSDATVLGAERVVLVETERTIVKSVGDARSERHRRVAVEAARQCGRGRLPEVEGPLAFDEAVTLPLDRRFVFAWRPEAQPLLRALEGWLESESLGLLIGPEGGLSDSEVELAIEHGYEPVSLGPLVLRTETAATVALGVVRAFADVRGFGASNDE